MNRDTFLRWWSAVAPRWLTRHWGVRFSGLWALLTDAIAEGGRQAARRRYIDQDTPESDLSLAGEVRGLQRYPLERASDYIARVNDHWEVWRRSTSAEGLRRLFQAAGYDAEVVRTGYAAYGIRAYGVAGAANVPTWGSVSWGQFAWGYAIDPQAIETLQEIARKHVPARMVYTGIIPPAASDSLVGATFWRWIGEDIKTGDWQDVESGDDIALSPDTANYFSYTASDSRFASRPTLTSSAAASYTGTVPGPAVPSGVVYAIFQADRIGGTVSWPLVSLGAGGALVEIYAQLGDGAELGVNVVAGGVLPVGESVVLDPVGPHIVALAWDGASYSLWVDGRMRLFNALTTAVDRGVGSLEINGGVTKGSAVIGEVGVWHGDPTPARMVKLARYARDIYGTPYRGPDPVTHPWAPLVRSYEWVPSLAAIDLAALSPLTWTPTPTSTDRVIPPSWASFSSPTAERTSRVSATAVRSGYASHELRWWSDGGVSGALIEPATTNLVPEPYRPSLWSFSLGPPTETTVTGPDGGTAYRYEDNDAAGLEYYGDVNALGVLSGTVVASVWVADVDSTQARFIASESGGLGAVVSVIVPGPTSGWAYASAAAYSATAPTTACEIDFRPAFIVADTGAASVWGFQVEDGRLYPTSFIEGSRAGEVLTFDGAAVAPNGVLDVAFTFCPQFASGERGEDFDLLRLDDDNRLRLLDDGSFEFYVGGSLLNGFLFATWDRYQRITVVFRVTPAGSYVEVSGATTGGGSFGDSVGRIWPAGDITLGAGVVLEGVAFTPYSPPRLAVEPPEWLSYYCVTEGTTSQQAQDMVSSGYASHELRRFSRGVGVGALIEPSTTNLVPFGADLSGWLQLGTPVLSSGTGPDGSTGVYYVADDAGGGAEYLRTGSASISLMSGDSVTLSAWTDVVSGGFALQHVTLTPSVDVVVNEVATGSAGWSFRGGSGIAAVSGDGEVRVGRVEALAATSQGGYWGVQVELRPHPTSFIYGSRAAGHLVGLLEDLTLDGTFRAELGIRFLFAHDEAGGDVPILYADDDNRCYYDATEEAIILSVDGIPDGISASFARYERIDVVINVTAEGASLTVGSTVVLLDADGGWPASGFLFLLSDASSWQHGGASVEYVRITR